jgi:phage/plasmid-like protein (TIGR03299 family)
MAHELDFSTGQAAIAYTGRVPWHGYGEPMQDNLPLDVWRQMAGLNWDVEEKPVFYRADDERGLGQTWLSEIPKKKVLIRSDTQDPLAIVSDRYKVVQPKQVLDFFESVIKENGFKMSTAGALRDGKRVWAMADTGEGFQIENGDRVGAHLLLATSYDGTFATTAQFTSIRVVCNNTLGFSLNRGGEGGIVRIPHTSDFNQWDIKADLGFDSSWSNFKKNIFELSQHTVTKREALNYFLTVMGVTEEEAADGKQLSNVKKLISLYESGPGSKLPSSQNTLWGALNAVTFMVDHCRAAKNTGNRFDSASFGGGANLKREAFKEAVRIAA